MIKPTPFEIVADERCKVGSDGVRTVVLNGTAGRMFRRRGVKSYSGRPAAEKILPLLNELSGLLVNNITMPAAEVAARLEALRVLADGAARPAEHIEWLVTELNGVYVYTMGNHTIVSTEDLAP